MARTIQPDTQPWKFDESVGRIYDTLHETGQLDNTLIVFTSDNGFVLGEHGRVDKRTLYGDSIRVPLVVRYPPLARPGTVIEPMILNHDLAPSILDICGAKPLRGITGNSWKPLLQGKRVAWRSSFLYEYNYEKQFPYTPNVRGVRTPEWKLITYPNGDGTPDRFTAELYNLSHDPLEMRNLINDPAATAMRKKLERELVRVSRQAGRDEMPIYEGIVNVLPEY